MEIDWGLGLFLICFAIVCIVWGMAFAFWLINLSIKRGKLPAAMLRQKDQILKILNEQGGDAYPQAPGSGPGVEVKSQ